MGLDRSRVGRRKHAHRGYCHNSRCHHHQSLDLSKLRDKLGTDALRCYDLIPKLKCAECGAGDKRATPQTEFSQLRRIHLDTSAAWVHRYPHLGEGLSERQQFACRKLNLSCSHTPVRFANWAIASPTLPAANSGSSTRKARPDTIATFCGCDAKGLAPRRNARKAAQMPPMPVFRGLVCPPPD